MQLLKLLSLGPTTRQLLMGWFDHPIPYVHKETGYVVLQHARFRTIFNRIFVALTVMALIFQALWPTKSDMVESISILLMIPAFSIILNFLFLKMFDLADERFIKDFLLLCKELSLTPQELAVTDPHKVRDLAIKRLHQYYLHIAHLKEGVEQYQSSSGEKDTRLPRKRLEVLEAYALFFRFSLVKEDRDKIRDDALSLTAQPA